MSATTQTAALLAQAQEVQQRIDAARRDQARIAAQITAAQTSGSAPVIMGRTTISSPADRRQA